MTEERRGGGFLKLLTALRRSRSIGSPTRRESRRPPWHARAREASKLRAHTSTEQLARVEAQQRADTDSEEPQENDVEF